MDNRTKEVDGLDSSNGGLPEKAKTETTSGKITIREGTAEDIVHVECLSRLEGRYLHVRMMLEAVRAFPGCLLLAEDRQSKTIVGMIVCIPGQKHVSVISLFIVAAACRGNGIGKSLLHEAINRKRNEEMTFRLVSHSKPSMFLKYGFREEPRYKSYHWKRDCVKLVSLIPDYCLDFTISNATSSDLPAILSYDQSLSNSSREWYLKALFASGGKMKIAVKKSVVVGFSVVFLCHKLLKIGIYADAWDVAKELLTFAVNEQQEGQTLKMFSYCSNSQAQTLADFFGFVVDEGHPILYLGEPLAVNVEKVYFRPEHYFAIY